MPQGHYPGRLTYQQWMARSIRERCLPAARAKSDLLGLWKSCSKKSCRRAHACQGDDKCWLRPSLPDLTHPNRNSPDFKRSYQSPEHLRVPTAILDQLPYLVEPWSLQAIVDHCGAEAGAKAAAALRAVFGLERRRRRHIRRRAPSK
jgi:hypothetical protein